MERKEGVAEERKEGGGQDAGYGGVAGCRGVGRNGGALEVAGSKEGGGPGVAGW